MQTERITILASPAAKQAMAARASSKGLSLGEYVRRKVLDEDDTPPEEEAELAELVAEVNLAIPRMQAALDGARSTIERLRAENDAFFRERGAMV